METGSEIVDALDVINVCIIDEDGLDHRCVAHTHSSLVTYLY
jgi:hypothetical protein